MYILFKSVTAGFCSVAHGLYYNVPKKSLSGNFIAGLLGILSYNILLIILESKFIALVISSIIIGVVAEIMSRIFRLPATVYLAPGLIPLVPGLTMFKTMQDLATQDFNKLFNHGTDLLLSAFALGLGVVISAIFSKTIHRYKEFAIKHRRMEKRVDKDK